MLTALIDSGFFGYIFPVLLILFLLFGYYMASKREKKTGKHAKLSGIESSVIGFFALLLSFTLASAGSAMKDRLSLIHQQADGLANLYRNSLVMPDSTQKQVSQFLLEHIDLQIKKDKYTEEVNDRLMKEIGENSDGFIHAMKVNGQLTAVLPAFNSLSSTTYKLIYSYEERIPSVIMILLVVSSLLIASLVGFTNGSNEERHYLAPLIYLVLVVLTIQAIRDLDNPRTGSVKPSMENLTAVRQMIEKGI